MNLNELITLSTQAFTYFQSKGGFIEGTPDDLPPERREKIRRTAVVTPEGVAEKIEAAFEGRY